MSNKPQNVKGMRDHLPKDMRLRQYITNTLTTVFERHSFEPLQTPIVEYAETLDSKIGDEEKLIYRFEDHGGRKLALRYDQTVSLARVVAQYQGQLAFPWKRYAIGQSYRGERPARGRYREFWQADIDIVGSQSPVADAEIVAIVDEALAALGFTGFTTLLNHRQILGGIARVAGLDEDSAGNVYRSIDKLDKIGVDGVREDLRKSGVSAEGSTRILDLISLRGTTEAVLRELSTLLKDDERALAALDNLHAITHALDAMGIPTERYAVAPHLSRALSYYTGVVFETVVETPPMGSLLGGGRYDELIGAFASRPIPTVGLAFGIDRLHDVMTELALNPNSATIADVFITIFDEGSVGISLQLATELRRSGFNVETALDGTEKLGKQFKYADRKEIPYALVLGPDELAQGTVVVRNMQNGEQRSVARSDVVATLQKSHS